jgi:hypothetical protein
MTLAHTADHKKSKQKRNDELSNLRWKNLPDQRANQIRLDTLKSAFVVVKDGIEKTRKEWVEFLIDKKNHMNRVYTDNMIKVYAIRKQYGFAYKEYPDLEGEVWKPIVRSETTIGRWDISNMNRVKQVTKHASNVLWGDRLGLDDNGYPRLGKWKCHIVSFQTFYPDLWAARKPGEIVRHKLDDKLDFRPHMLLLGTGSDNIKDAYDNGKRDDAKNARMKCASHIDGVFEKEHVSQMAAAEYLISKKCSDKSIKSVANSVSDALLGRNKKTAYGRTWNTV